jgi:hypothetical protein
MNDWLHATPSALRGKRAFRLGLTANYGIDEDGVRAAIDRGVNVFLWTMRNKGMRAPVKVAMGSRRDAVAVIGIAQSSRSSSSTLHRHAGAAAAETSARSRSSHASRGHRRIPAVLARRPSPPRWRGGHAVYALRCGGTDPQAGREGAGKRVAPAPNQSRAGELPRPGTDPCRPASADHRDAAALSDPTAVLDILRLGRERHDVRCKR